MSKKIIIACLAIIFLLPVMFLGPHEKLSVGQYFMSCVMPLMIVVVFLVNYLWLVPRCLERDDRKKLIIANACLILSLSIFMVFWHKMEFTTFLHDREHQSPMPEGRNMPPRDRSLVGYGERIVEGERIGDEGRIGERERIGDGHKDSPPRRESDDIFYIFAALRDSINLVFALFVAYTIRINEHISDLRRLQQEAVVARREAELRGLRNQISPHFLLNTLNNIYALAAISAERTQGAVMQLSKMLRHMLYDNQAEMVTLKSEADFIHSYIDLMKLRLASNVKVKTDFNIPEDSQTQVAPLLFISLVENAFKHGVSSTAPCFINISIKEEGGVITCDIANSNNPKMSSDRSGHGVGLINVQQRLDITYPGRYEWTKGVENDKTYHSLLKLKTT